MRHALLPLAVAAAAIAAVLAGAWLDPRSALAAWLAAIEFWLALPLGAAALALIGAATGTSASMLPGGAPLATLPVLALAFLPILAGAELLYPWTAAESGGLWLNAPFFTMRATLYWATWLGVAAMALRRPPVRSAAAALGLLALAFTVNFAAIDWMMSLDPAFASSSFGYSALAATLTGGLAFLLLAQSAPAEGQSARAGILLALVVASAYLDFMQYLIVWESDLAREIPWYLAREAGPWPAVGIAMALTHFLLPFLALLSPGTRRGGARLAATCALVLIGRLLLCWWLVIPGVGGATLSWQAPLAVIALGALLLAAQRAGALRLFQRLSPAGAGG